VLFQAEYLCLNKVTPILEQGVCLESRYLHSTPGTAAPLRAFMRLLSSKPCALAAASLLPAITTYSSRRSFCSSFFDKCAQRHIQVKSVPHYPAQIKCFVLRDSPVPEENGVFYSWGAETERASALPGIPRDVGSRELYFCLVP